MQSSTPQATATLIMVAKVESFVKHDFPAPSFSFGFPELSQEDTLTQEGQPAAEKGKIEETPILIEELEELVEQVVSIGVVTVLNFAEDKSPPCQKVKQPTECFVTSSKLLRGGTKYQATLKKNVFSGPQISRPMTMKVVMSRM